MSLLIKLKVHPDSKKSAISKKSPDAYEVWVRAPAENGLANKEALAALAGAIGSPAKNLVIVKGASSPAKIVKIYP